MATQFLKVRGLGLVPVDADSVDAAKAKWLSLSPTEQQALRAEYVADLRSRSARLGIEPADLETLEGSTRRTVQPFTNPADDLNFIERTGAGVVRAMRRAGTGIHQVALEWFGEDSDETKQVLSELRKEEETERRAWEMYADEGIGFEDVGEMIPAAGAFLLSGGSIPAIVGTGAVLGYTDSLTGEEGEGTRLGRGAVGGGTAALLPVAGRTSAAIRGVTRPAMMLTRRFGNYLAGFRTRGTEAMPGLMKNAVDETADLLANQSPAARQLGEVVYDRIVGVLDHVTRGTVRSGRATQAEAYQGVVQNALKKSTIADELGTRVDFAAFSREMAGNAFRNRANFQPDIAAALTAVTNLTTRLSRMDLNAVAPEQLYAMANAIVSAPLKSGPLMKALELAKDPALQKSLMEQIMQIGFTSIRGTPELAYRGALGATAGFEAGQNAGGGGAAQATGNYLGAVMDANEMRQ